MNLSNFFTSVAIKPVDDCISYDNQVVTVGSCFADHISNRLNKLKYKLFTNPFGIMYNPVSLSRSLGLFHAKYEFDESAAFKHQGLWRHFDVHSNLSDASKAQFLSNINHNIEKGQQFVNNKPVYIITLGSAYVWENNETNKIVANCHKIAATQFSRSLLNADECIHHLSSIIHIVNSINSEAKVIFTVSPIRHIRDGLINNNLSKSTLIYAVNEVVQSYENVSYFPAFEIMMDELRDYRFYKQDKIHPTDLAVDYIIDRFISTYFNEKDINIHKQMLKLNRLLNHRPLHPESDDYKKYLLNAKAFLYELIYKYPNLSFEEEKLHFKA